MDCTVCYHISFLYWPTKLLVVKRSATNKEIKRDSVSFGICQIIKD